MTDHDTSPPVPYELSVGILRLRRFREDRDDRSARQIDPACAPMVYTDDIRLEAAELKDHDPELDKALLDIESEALQRAKQVLRFRRGTEL